MRKVKIIGNSVELAGDKIEAISCPLDHNHLKTGFCIANCAWFRKARTIGTKENPRKLQAYCGDKLIGEIVE